jgi:hypothetical protein
LDSSSTSLSLANQTLYADVTVASGATGTGDVYVYGYDFS